MTQPVRVGLVFDYTLGYSRGVLRGIKQFAVGRPHWILAPVDTDSLSAAALMALEPAGVIGTVLTHAVAELLRSTRRPVVNVANVLPDMPFPRVSVNHGQVGELAALHLQECGLRHFAFVGHPRHRYSIERESGFRDALSASGWMPARFYDRPSRSYRSRGRLMALNQRLQHWLAERPKPVGIFACHDIFALQIVEACRLAGLRVPEEVAVLGVDNDDLLCELARPSLSSVMVPAERVGYEAAALLDRLMGGKRSPRRPRLIPPPGVVTRQSTDVVAIEDTDVVSALRFIREQGHRPLRVDDVLRHISISRRALERRFHDLLQRGLGEEIRREHIERAKHLLATTELSMADVAQRAGFASQPQLSRVFRQDAGLTPTAFRRQSRQPAAK